MRTKLEIKEMTRNDMNGGHKYQCERMYLIFLIYKKKILDCT